MIVGTAGHIDHGKTALVKALTGVDADRLKEEKARGITIDLGFAYQPGPEGRITGFVDVPGHERFVHTMLAGASGIDFALLVVAADDGIMPQTLEHLAILDLLGVGCGLVALSKVDRADAPRRATVTAEIRAALASTGLGAAPILPVSVVTGEGIATLEAALAQAERALPAAKAEGRFRLAVDRCFTLAGAGTIVTGTVLSGAVAVGDQVVVSPSGLAARVRSIHAQNRPAQRGLTGQRCALNLAGEAIAKEAVARGDMVLDAELHAPTQRIDAEFRLLAAEARPLDQGFPARLHHAGAQAGVRLVPLGPPIAPGATEQVQLVLDRPIAAAAGDRFVLRDVSARRTLGGGRFLDLRPPARKRRTPERLAALTALAETEPATALTRLLAVPPYAVDVAVFARDHALTAAQIAAACSAAGAVVLGASRACAGSRSAGGVSVALSQAQWQAFLAALVARVEAFHAASPELQGIGRERLRLETEPRLSQGAFLASLDAVARSGLVVLEGAFVRSPGHVVRLEAADTALWEALAPRLVGAVRFRPPRVRELAGLLGRDEAEIRRVLKLCARLGRVDEIAHDHFFARATTAEMVELACEAAAEAEAGAFTAAAFRDRMSNGRKVAIEILDFFDRHGVTLRRGDRRRINRHRLDLFRQSLAGEAEGREASPVGRPDFKSGWGSGPVPGGFDSRSLPPLER